MDELEAILPDRVSISWQASSLELTESPISIAFTTFNNDSTSRAWLHDGILLAWHMVYSHRIR